MQTNNATRMAMQALDSANAPTKLAAAEYEDKRGSLAKATAIFTAGLVAKQITQAQLKDAKGYVSDALQGAWREVNDLLLTSSRSEFHDDLYWKSLYRPELHRLGSAIKLADAAKSGNADEAAAIAKAKAILAAFKPYADAVDLLKGMIVKRVVKSEEEKKADRLVPQTAASAEVLAAVNKVIERQRPELVIDYTMRVRAVLGNLQKKFGKGLAKLGRRDDEMSAYDFISRFIVGDFRVDVDSLEKRIDGLQQRMADADAMTRIRLAGQLSALTKRADTAIELDAVKIKEAANAFVDMTFDEVRAKIMAKAGELQNPEVKDMSGARFVVTGSVHGKPVRLEQSIILNFSVNGKAFNQYPCRITLDGKAASEAEYKTFMLSGG